MTAGAMTRAMVLEAPGRMALHSFPRPALGPDEALLRVEMVGVCGTDVGVYRNKSYDATWPYPLILGHEIVGVVEEVGDTAARRHGVASGDRVTISTIVGCGFCRPCRTGRPVHCDSTRKYGLTVSCAGPPHLWGGMAEHLYVDPRAFVHRLAPTTPPEVGVLISAVLANGIRWVGTRVSIGDTVVVVGPGPQGLAGLIAAREAGASKVIVCGLARDRRRLELAREFGATDVLEADKDDPLELVRDLTRGAMAEVAMDASGSRAGARLSLDLVGKGGKVITPGLYGFDTEVPLILDKLVAKEITLHGVRSQDVDSVIAAVRVAESGRYPLEKMVTHRFPLERSADAIRLVAGEIPADDFVKAVVVP